MLSNAHPGVLAERPTPASVGATDACWPAYRVGRRTLFVSLPLAVASLLFVLALPGPSRAVAAPLLAIVNITAGFLIALRNRDVELPIFEVGTLCVTFTALYSAYPLFAFLMSGGEWSAVSDGRLQQWSPEARAVGDFAWRHVLYLGAFALAYVPLRGRATAARVPMGNLTRPAVLVVAWLLLALTTYFAAIWIIFGVTYSPSYSDAEIGSVGLWRDLPYVLQQISHNAKGIVVLLKICAIAVLLHWWRSPAARTVLLAWIGLEVVATALRMGARSDVLILLVAAALLYHRIVAPLRARWVALAGVALLGLALLFGFVRDFNRLGRSLSSTSYWSAANEFQILMGTAYDLHLRSETGSLPSIPWQVHASDLLRLVPSQLLPVTKIEPADWYLDELGYRHGNAGLMFGVVAQSVIGYDWIELVARGAMLGVLFAIAHRYYVRNASSFWASILYLYLCLWTYYTFRASTFYFLYPLLYRFLPTMILVRAAAGLVRRAALAAAPAPRRAGDPSCAES